MKYSCIALLAFCLHFGLSSCKDDNPVGDGGISGEGTFTVTGAGLNNVTFTVPSNPIPGGSFNPFAFGAFDPNEVATFIITTGIRTSDSLSAAVSIAFGGNQTGNFQGNSSTPRIVYLAINDKEYAAGFEFNEPGSPTIPNTTFNLNVTRYDAVGGRIQGTYNATMRELLGKGGLGNTFVSVTGNFNVQRLSDGSGSYRALNPLFYRTVQVE